MITATITSIQAQDEQIGVTVTYADDQNSSWSATASFVAPLSATQDEILAKVQNLVKNQNAVQSAQALVGTVVEPSVQVTPLADPKLVTDTGASPA